MNVRIHIPKSESLQLYVQFFLFIKHSGVGPNRQICYPNTNHCLGLLSRSEIKSLGAGAFRILPSEANTSYLTGIYNKPISITADLPYNEVCINFTPLGLDVLCGKKVSGQKFKSRIIEEVLGNKWSDLYQMAFSSRDEERSIQEIENFLMEQMAEPPRDLLLFQNTQHILEMAELCDHLCKSYRSTHRFFKQNLDISPKEYLLINTVRRSMKKLFDYQPSKVAEIMDFYDAAHFTHTFKKIVGVTPSAFKSVSSLEADTLIWSVE